jgi:hypothetical protein
MTVRHLVIAFATAAFLAALAYAGYINELLKGAVSDFNRALLVIGFVIGAYGSSRALLSWADRSIAKRRRGESRKR